VVAASKVVPSDLMEQLSAVVSHDHSTEQILVRITTSFVSVSEEHAELSYVASVHLVSLKGTIRAVLVVVKGINSCRR
jgi:hypothetical protein